MFKNLTRSFKKIYYHKIRGFRPTTVVLRHKINDTLLNYLLKHRYFLNLKNYGQWERENFNKEIFVEFGFGSAEYLISLGKENRLDKNIQILGVELYEPGVIKALQQIDKNNLENIFVSKDDARDILKEISKNVLSKVFILFPDPWTKKRQFERRLVNLQFLKDCLKKLKTKGEIILATDWENYALDIEKILNVLKDKKYIDYKKFTKEELSKFPNICNTNFANRAKREGRNITVFVSFKR